MGVMSTSVGMLALCLLFGIAAAVTAAKEKHYDPLFGVDGRECFCKVEDDNISDCRCENSIDEFNNRALFPMLQQLLQKDFFRYYKVNMEKRCPFWTEEGECASRECGIENCDDEVPDAIRRDLMPAPPPPVGPPGVRSTDCNDDHGEANAFDPLDVTISQSAKSQFDAWARHDDAENKFCDWDGQENTDGMHYVDMQRNPERYTGYKGNSAQRVWRCIYQENCFKPNPKFDKNFLLHPSITGLCLEKRAFFRLMSGLHTSITVSIAAHNFQPAVGGMGQGKWVRNIEMFKSRFFPERTWGEGPERLKNLYFTYLLELRALQKAAPYLRSELFYTGNAVEDRETRDAVSQILSAITEWGDNHGGSRRHFDESRMFGGAHLSDALARQLKEEFRQHFLNVSRIMDCVGCDKCRLWGKLQAHGMGTALKILFSDLPRSHYGIGGEGEPSFGNSRPHVPFQLRRNEVVALFQSLGRYAANVREVDEFRRELMKQQQSGAS